MDVRSFDYLLIALLLLLFLHMEIGWEGVDWMHLAQD
jgi:hypothetical protein